jgi:hypothetical protein
MWVLPCRAWARILDRAQVLGLRRDIPHADPHPFNVYHRTMRYDDLEAAAQLVDDPVQQDRLRELVDSLARQTVSGGLSAHWWLPLDSVSYAGNPDTNGAPALLYPSDFAYGSHRRDESSRH